MQYDPDNESRTPPPVSPGNRAPVLGQQIFQLEGFNEDFTSLRKLRIQPFPFVVGRRPGLQLCLGNESISRLHSEIYIENGRILIKDLGSRNGTYVNRRRIDEPVELQVGDIIHFASCEFRLTFEYDPDGMSDTASHTLRFNGVLSENLAAGLSHFIEMLNRAAVLTSFQPIMDLRDDSIHAYEALGRGNYHGAPVTPTKLFELAASCGKERDLCRLFREKAYQSTSRHADLNRLFVNLHPAELRDVHSMVDSLSLAASCLEGIDVVVEIHESTVAHAGRMKEICQAIRDLGMKVAYDDFGSGQARMLELVEVPPDYLKFDRTLISGINAGPERRQRMVEMLVQYATNFGVQTIAEGVEEAAEAETCRQLGFGFGQGYLFGRPDDHEQLNENSTVPPLV